MGYIFAGMGLIIIILTGGLTYQTEKLNSTRGDFQAFRATTQAFAEASVREAEKKDKDYEAQAKLNNTNWSSERAALVATSDRLHNDLRARASVITKPTPETSSTETICYDWAELDRAELESETEAERISQAGAEARTDLNAAITWADPIWAGQEAVEAEKEKKNGKSTN